MGCKFQCRWQRASIVLLFLALCIYGSTTLGAHSDHSQEFYIDLSPYLDKSFQEAIESIGCQPIIIDIPKEAVFAIYEAFNRGPNHKKICEITERWGEEFIKVHEGPWADTNYRFGIFDKGGYTHKKSRLIQGINCKITREYCEWVEEQYREELVNFPELKLLFKKLLKIEEICHDLLIKKIEKIAEDFPNIKNIFYTRKNKKR